MSRYISRYRGLLALITVITFIATGTFVMWQSTREAKAGTDTQVARFSTGVSSDFSNTNNVVIVPGIAATGTITLSTAVPADGDTVTVGTIIYTFKTTLTGSNTVPNLPNEVKIGGTLAASATNLSEAINGTGGGGAGVDFSNGTQPNRDVTAAVVGAVVTVTARVNGNAGNAIGLAKVFATGANGTVSGATLAGGSGRIGFASNKTQNTVFAFDSGTNSSTASVSLSARGLVGAGGSVDAIGVGNGPTPASGNSKRIGIVDSTNGVVRFTDYSAAGAGSFTAPVSSATFTGINGNSNIVLFDTSGAGDVGGVPEDADEAAVAIAGSNNVRLLNAAAGTTNSTLSPAGTNPIWVDAKTFVDGSRPTVTTLGLVKKVVVIANQGSNTVSIFASITLTGAMSEVGTANLSSAGFGGLSTWNNVVMSADGKSCYIASNSASRIVRIAIDTSLGVTGTILANGVTGISPQMIAVSQTTGRVAVANVSSGSITVYPADLALATTATSAAVLSLNNDSNPAFGGAADAQVFIGSNNASIFSFNATTAATTSGSSPNGGGPGSAPFFPPVPTGATSTAARLAANGDEVVMIDRQSGSSGQKVFHSTIAQADGANGAPRNSGVTSSVATQTVAEGSPIVLTPSWVDDDRNDITSITGQVTSITIGGTEQLSAPQTIDVDDFSGTFGALTNTLAQQRNFASRALSYTPNLDTVLAGQTAIITFSFTATDSQGATAPETAQIAVTNNAVAQSATDPTVDAVTTPQNAPTGTTTQINVTARDIDAGNIPVFKGAVGNAGPPYLQTFKIEDATGGNATANANLRAALGGVADAVTRAIPNNAVLSLQGGSNATGVNTAVLSFTPPANTAGAQITLSFVASDGDRRSAPTTLVLNVTLTNVAPTITFATANAQVRQDPAADATADTTFNAFEDITTGTFDFTVTFNDANTLPAAQTVAADVSPVALRALNGFTEVTINGRTIRIKTQVLGGATFGAAGDDRTLTATFRVGAGGGVDLPLTDLDGSTAANLFASAVTFTATDSFSTPATTTRTASFNIIDANTTPTFANSAMPGTTLQLAAPIVIAENVPRVYVQLVRDTDSDHSPSTVSLLNAAGTAPYTTVNGVGIELGTVNATTGVFTAAGSTTLTLTALAAPDGDVLAGSFTGRFAIRVTPTFNSTIGTAANISAQFRLRATNTFNSFTKTGALAPTTTAATTNSADFSGGAVTVQATDVNRAPAIAFTATDAANAIGVINTGTGAVTSTISVNSATESQRLATDAAATAGIANVTMSANQTVRIGVQGMEADTNVGTDSVPAGSAGTLGATQTALIGSSVTITRVTNGDGTTASGGGDGFAFTTTILQPAAASTTTLPTLAGATAGPAVLQFPQSFVNNGNNLNTLVTGTTTANFFRIDFNAQDNNNQAGGIGTRTRRLVVKVISATNNNPTLTGVLSTALANDTTVGGAANDNLRAANIGNGSRIFKQFRDRSDNSGNTNITPTDMLAAAPSTAGGGAADGSLTDAEHGWTISAPIATGVPTYFINEGDRLTMDLDSFASDLETNNFTNPGGQLTWTATASATAITALNLSATSGTLSGITGSTDPAFSGATADDFAIAPPFNVLSTTGSAVFAVTIQIQDPNGGFSASRTINVQVYNRTAFNNIAPTWTSPATEPTTTASVRQGGQFNLTVSATDLNLGTGAPETGVFDILATSVTGMTFPQGAVTLTVSVQSTNFRWDVPASQAVGTYVVVLRYRDAAAVAAPNNGATRTLNISVTAQTGPTANADAFTPTEDTPFTQAAPGVLANDTDPNSDPLTATLVTNVAAAAGSVTLNADGSFTYTPALNFNGVATFTYTASDTQPNGTSNVATVTLTVGAVNDAPVAADGTLTTDEDTAGSGTLVATDVDNSPPSSNPAQTLTFSIVTNGTKGTAVITDPATGAFTYTPNLNANGTDTFTFKANDGTVDSNTATVTVTITPVNDAPVASNGTLTPNEDTAASGTLVATDVDGDALTFSVVTNGTKGTAVITDAATGAFTYTPNANANGTDSFTFRANDGTENSNTATVVVTITPVNDAPVANNLSIATLFNQAVNFTVTAADPDTATGQTETLTFQLLSVPSNGNVTAFNSATGVGTYTPNAGFSGTDSFTFNVNDGTLISNTATVTVSVAANGAPVANNDAFAATEDIALGVAAAGVLTNDTDAEGNPLTAILVTNVAAAAGSVTLSSNGGFTYTPAANFNGTATFTYKANDGTLDSNVATVTITVAAVNDAPVASDGTLTTDEDTAGSGTLVATDIDGDALTFSIVANGTKGTAVITDPATGAFTYTPNLNANGTDTFTFKANDGTVDSNTATVTVTITPVNDAPVANDGTLTTNEDTAGSGTLVATDVDGDALTFSIVANGTKGTAVITNAATGAFTYTPNANANGTDSFTFRASDGTANSNTATITVTINAVNDAPVAANDTFSTQRDTVLNILPPGVLANDTDVEGSALTAVLVAGPAASEGTVALAANGSFTFTPAASFVGTATFTYKANDGSADSNTATVTITVTKVNRAPVASNGTLTTNEDTAGTGTMAATDPDSDPLTFFIVTNGTKGTAVITDAATGAFTYTPNANASGSDSFTFVANDGTLNSNFATVTVTITPVNDAPVANNGTLTTNEDTTAAGALVATDADGDALTFSIVTNGTKGTAVITNAATGAFTYTPNANANGTDSFTFQASDGTANSNTATVTVTITPVNDAPAASAGAAISVNELGTATFAGATATDVDADTLTISWAITGGATNGTLTGANTLTPTYTAPDLTTEVSRTVTAVLTVTDSGGQSSTSSKTITVNRTLSVTGATFASKTLTITGTGFAAGAVVKIDGVTTLIAPSVSGSTTLTISGKRKKIGYSKGTHTITVTQGANVSNAITASI